jgi:hypothetical protein
MWLCVGRPIQVCVVFRVCSLDLSAVSVLPCAVVLLVLPCAVILSAVSVLFPVSSSLVLSSVPVLFVVSASLGLSAVSVLPCDVVLLVLRCCYLVRGFCVVCSGGLAHVALCCSLVRGVCVVFRVCLSCVVRGFCVAWREPCSVLWCGVLNYFVLCWWHGCSVCG